MIDIFSRSKKTLNSCLDQNPFCCLIDDSKCSNMGYAFVNLTTPEAARRLHYALHGARWKVHGTKKIIEICAARIQVHLRRVKCAMIPNLGTMH
jgi:hypothetical protein